MAPPATPQLPLAAGSDPGGRPPGAGVASLGWKCGNLFRTGRLWKSCPLMGTLDNSPNLRPQRRPPSLGAVSLAGPLNRSDLPTLDYYELATAIRRGLGRHSWGKGKRGAHKLRDGPSAIGNANALLASRAGLHERGKNCNASHRARPLRRDCRVS
jgi:hypothetical protein